MYITIIKVIREIKNFTLICLNPRKLYKKDFQKEIEADQDQQKQQE